MVGFGSCLRIARRVGWEGAYLDYETLKLLLSQIEAVYEEEGYRARSRQQELEDAKPKDSLPQSTHALDYRDELFLEDDSDAAYASIDVDEDEDDYEDGECDKTAVDERQYQQQYFANGQSPQLPAQRDNSFPSQTRSLILNPSREQRVQRTGDDSRSKNCCFGFCARSASQNNSFATRRKKRHNWSQARIAEDESNSFYIKNGPSEPNTFFLTANDEDNGNHQLPADAHGLSLLNAPTVRRFFLNESSNLLPTPAPGSSSFFTFSDPLTNSPQQKIIDQRQLSSRYPQQLNSLNLPSFTESSSPFLESNRIYTIKNPRSQLQGFSPTLISKRESTQSIKRKREGHARRSLRRRIRERREKRIPRHIRVAHARAREITERFLGLLRAETEKVLLFAQSRLGELADTAGSLRFPSFDEEYGSTNATSVHYHYQNFKIHRKASKKPGAYDYPLADGGMHPSASSSSDEGGTGGLFSWSDDGSSEDDKDTNGQANMKLHGKRGPSSSVARPSPYSDDMTEPSIRSDTTGNRIENKGSTIRKNDIVDAARRQIAHFAELRKNRTIFQRNDQILGEDMQFLSAVEEADGYTAVGVELLHVLKYINVNLIAVRKICRKHDRLLMNRMLGGYYHRAKNHYNSHHDSSLQVKNSQTLGGLMARVSGEVYEAHPALIGQMNHFKLVGVYDMKIQNLANSRTVEVVSSCLALALSEYEVARSRARALTKRNSRSSTEISNYQSSVNFEFENLGLILSTEGIESEGPPSTASGISLTRLRFTVTSIFALREAARYKTDSYMTYLSRLMLTFSGQTVVGEGLDGCSRETLDFVVSYNADAGLLFDSAFLYEGIKRGQWRHLPIDEIMISTLALAITPIHLPSSTAVTLLPTQEELVANAVSVVPESKSVMLKRLIRGQFPRRLTGRRVLAAEEVPKIALKLNRLSCFLFWMNYFIPHSTASLFVTAQGYQAGYSAIIIGVPNLSAIIMTVLHCWSEAGEHVFLPYRYSVVTLKYLFLFSSFMAATGNMINAIAIYRSSVQLAVLGRFVFGFSSAEILHRQLMAACMPSHFVTESARLMLFRVSGSVSGLLFGSVTEAIPIQFRKLGAQTSQVSSWLMMLFWTVHAILVLSQFHQNLPTHSKENASILHHLDQDGRNMEKSRSEDSHSSSSEVPTPSTVLYRKKSERSVRKADSDLGTRQEKLPISSSKQEEGEFIYLFGSTAQKRKRMKRVSVSQTKFFARLRKFVSYHLCIPVSLIMISYATFSIETLFSATPLITARYFAWTGANASSLLGWLAAMILPTHFVCEIVARLYEERTVAKQSLIIIVMSLLFMLNWGSLYSLAQHMKILLVDTTGTQTYRYDGGFGILQYIVGLMIAFAGFVALEGAALSLLSKICPAKSRSVVNNVGTYITFLGSATRLFANFNITVMDLSDKLINTDIVNSLLMPLLICSLIILYFVKKHFYFLM